MSNNKKDIDKLFEERQKILKQMKELLEEMGQILNIIYKEGK